MKNRSRMIVGTTLGVSLLVLSALIHSPAEAANENNARRAQVISHWTAERRAAAIPRDLVIDPRGLGYLRRADGSLMPHGHQISANDALPAPRAKPGGGGGGNDGTPPVISNLSPGSSGAIIGASHTFSATVTDNVGVRSVTFVFTYPDGSTSESFSAANSGGDNWSLTVSGFTDGAWSWRVEARDTAKRGGNSASSAEVSFTVSTGGGSGGGGGSNDDTITNSQWNGGGQVQQAVGRLFFEMPSNSRRKGPWTGYVCSGTVVTDGKTGRSVILTASHCVYDDANNAFARNVLFIPAQAGTSGSGTDSNCSNDPIGCWVASFGVVDENWTTSVFPNNRAWDYAFYVVSDVDSHQPGETPVSSILDDATPAMDVYFTAPFVDDPTDGEGAPDFTHGMGYSYSDDPNFMYCAEDVTTEGAVNLWLPSCGLSGGSSGGPWIQPLTSGSGPIISVNSWGYTTSPGMAGPKLWNTSITSASCVYNAAALSDFPLNPKDGDAGYAVNCQ